MINIVQAGAAHIDDVARLFDLYRQFYDCEADLDLAKRFIGERIGNQESTIFVAEQGDELIGFTQLYPSFCSVDAIKIFILYDLYVDAGGRQAGVGEKLMNRASDYARSQGAKRIDLLTAFDNKPGQRLYEKLGYEKTNQDFHSYSLTL
ncbi:MAG: GNAT family N-acetyltransferase [Candidatus Pelagadaptatus aseana]|uniref:GNAT family N-acetyltransferase n=1 Tax=Candidatus Pelagadaptatus aseana TaxID=3120508 RepID=UPI0039B224AA